MSPSLSSTKSLGTSKARNEPADSSIARTAPAESITDQIKKLGQLRDVGLLTDDEFNTKKAELLARL